MKVMYEVILSTVMVVAVFLAFLLLFVMPTLHNAEPCGWCRDPGFQAEHGWEPGFAQRCLDECNITVTATPACCPCSPEPTQNTAPTATVEAWWNYTVQVTP
jgi:hypothetical protein